MLKMNIGFLAGDRGLRSESIGCGRQRRKSIAGQLKKIRHLFD
jgi:hypothetical protein